MKLYIHPCILALLFAFARWRLTPPDTRRKVRYDIGARLKQFGDAA